MPLLHAHPRPWNARVLAGAAAVVAVAALAPAARAATLDVDQRCYVPGETAAVDGSGFSPRSPLTLTRAGELLPGAVADNSGATRVKVTVPPVASGLVESQVELSASDGTTTARTLVNIATVGANFTPTTGDPRTLRVSHVISGFGLAETKPSIYLHYVSPAAQRAALRSVTGAMAARASVTGTTPSGSNGASTGKTGSSTGKTGSSTGKSGSSSAKTGGSAPTVPATDPPGVKSIRLGQLRGPCGVLRTSPRRLFPFKVTDGEWLLQYDTRPHYTRGTTTSPFLWVSRPVTVEN